MNKLIKFIIVCFCYISVTYGMAYSMEQTPEARIGFEVEMPFLGASTLEQGKEFVDDVVLLESKGFWKLQPDTLDFQVAKEYSQKDIPGIWNLEFKTPGNGFVLQEQEKIKQAMVEINEVVGFLVNHSKQELSFGSKKFLVATIPKEEILQKFSKLNCGVDKICVVMKTKTPEDLQKVRPQITYQLPMNYLPALFRHLYILGGDPKISSFFAPNNTKNIERLKTTNLIKAQYHDGLSLLFDFYIARLFSAHNTQEPGPKASFSVMSRLNFRDMYKSLKGEGDQFTSYVTTNYSNFFLQDNSYRKFDDEMRDTFTNNARSISVYKSLQKQVKENVIDKLHKDAFSLMDFMITALHQGEQLFEKLEQGNNQIRSELEKLKQKAFKDRLTTIYAASSLKPFLFSVSIEELLPSIINANFEVEIVTESESNTQEQEKIIKKTDWFSNPLPFLDEKYSMGILPHPYNAKFPIAVVEVRSYSTVFFDITLDQILNLLMTESYYFMQVIKSTQDINNWDIQNLKDLEQSKLIKITGNYDKRLKECQ